jgi:uncharacterized protein (DUF302 family)
VCVSPDEIRGGYGQAVIRRYVMRIVWISFLVLIGSFLFLNGGWSSDVRLPSQPVVVNSHNSFSGTVDKLRGAIEARALSVIFEVNHGKIVGMAGSEAKGSVTIGFVGSKIQNQILSAESRAALEIPLRIAVRELDSGRVDLVYFQPSYLFAHYQNKNLDKLSRAMDILVGSIIKEAAESNE